MLCSLATMQPRSQSEQEFAFIFMSLSGGNFWMVVFLVQFSWCLLHLFLFFAFCFLAHCLFSLHYHLWTCPCGKPLFIFF